MEQNYIKLRPFTCYFCNKRIENDTEQGHMAICGHVLEPCPNKCGSYVQRSMKIRHMKECQNSRWKSMPKLPNSIDYRDDVNGDSTSDCGSLGGNSTKNLPSTEMVQMYKKISFISSKLQVFEQTCRQSNQNRDIINRLIVDLQKINRNELQWQIDLDRIKSQSDILNEWRKNVEMQLSYLKQQSILMENLKSDQESHLMSIQSKFSKLDKLENCLHDHKNDFVKEQLEIRETLNDFREDLYNFKDFYAQENAITGALWNDQKIQIDNLQESISNINKAIEEQRIKYSSLIFDVRAVTQISTEALEKVEIKEKHFVEIEKQIEQLKVDLGLVEALASKNCNSNFNTPGQLLWQVDNFASKMESAKQHDTVFKSPTFYTHNYGYKIRILLFLNGIKKWKGRYMLASIHVLKGEYDLLLKWPCHIAGDIILKDLENKNNPKNFAKYISAKRQSGGEENEEPQESSNQYIFIPHTTLNKRNFLENDTLFIEIKIDQKFNNGLETNL